MQDKGIQLTPADSVKLKVKPVQLFKGMAKILKDANPFTWTSIPSNAIDTIEAIKLDGEGRAASTLVCRALADTLLTLITETRRDFSKNDIETFELDRELDALLAEDDFFVDNDFFDHPERLPFFQESGRIVKDFLRQCDFEDNEIEQIVPRLKSYFVFSLQSEWRGNTKYYDGITRFLNTPFDKVIKKESEWSYYANYLQREINCAVFSELFSLQQIYIPLRGYYKKKSKKNDSVKSSKDELSHDKPEKIVVDLEEEILSWLKKSDKDDAIRVIRGGPGYGKSSFMKMLAAKLSSQNHHVIFVPLHRFEVKDDMVDAIHNFLKYDSYLTFDPFEEEQLILVFDGLDELSMQGKILGEVANRFVGEVQKKVMNFNHQKAKVQVLISGRDVVVQQNESEFRREGEILTILPYYLSDDERKEYVDNKHLLEEDQRSRWWKNYGTINGKNYAGIPEELKTRDFEEITAQPLLNYLIALSYERGKVRFTKETNLNIIYGDLLGAVYERAYDPAKIHRAVKQFKYDDFQRVLEEIAVAAWHGNGRTTNVQEIEKHFHDAGLQKLLDNFLKDAEKGIVSLLAAFYFRQAGSEQSGSQTFEFTHKSFGEYLTAQSIVRKVKQLSKKYREHDRDVDEGWSIQECLKRWIELFGLKAVDEDLMKFVQNEYTIMLEKHPEQLQEHQQTIIAFINRILASGTPMELLNPRPPFGQENRQAINAEKALLILLGTISSLTKEISNISWPRRDSFGEWIGRLMGQRIGGDVFFLKYLNHLNVSGSILHIKDFYGANLSFSDLSSTALLFANLKGANLKGANLRGVNIRGADLSGANLKNAIVTEAQLRLTRGYIQSSTKSRNK